MRRQGSSWAWMPAVSILAAGCAEGGRAWNARQTPPQGQDTPVVASEVNEAVHSGPQDRADGPAPVANAGADASAEAVTSFVRRLQHSDDPQADANADSEDLQALPAGDLAAGAIAAAANRPLALPPGPGEPVAIAPLPVTTAQATEPPRIEAVSVEAAAPGPAQTSQPRTLSTNEPLDATAAAEQLSIRKYAEKLGEALRADPADVELQWRLSAAHLALGEQEQAAAVAGGIAHEPAALIRDAVRLFAGVQRLTTDPAHPAEDTLAAVEGLRRTLQERAELAIPVAALCTRVRTFGVYDEMPAEQLVPHRPNRAVLYTEVKNFVSNKLPGGEYETRLAGRLELMTPEGRLLWQHEEGSIKEVSRQRREDFFLAQLVTLPADLGPGDYVLKVSIQDLLGGKANEAHLRFSIGQPQLTRASP